MATQSIDFKKLNSDLLGQVLSLLPAWLPGGRLVGSEFSCGDINGGAGDSFKVNINNGFWADFASNEKGGDLISLYAAIKGISQIDAARELGGTVEKKKDSSLNPPKQLKTANLVHPPEGVVLDKFKHYKLGEPTKTWIYRDKSGRLCFYISRYETEKGKELRPWSYSNEGKWTNKAWADNRPLYNVHNLKPDRPVLIVEGEKCVDSATAFASKYYDVVTWSGGAQAIEKSNWSDLYGKAILIWPDADQPGIGAGNRIADLLLDHVKECKVIDVSDVESQGWDAADSGFDTNEFIKWAKPRASQYVRPLPVVIEEYGYADKMPDMPPDAPLEIMIQDPEANRVMSQDHLDYLHSLGLSFQTNGKTLHTNADNVGRICANDESFKNKFWYDDFYKRIYTNFFGPTVELSDSIIIQITVLLQRKYNLVKMSKTVVDEGIKSYVFHNIRNEPRDWMETLVWDKVPRIHDFFSKYMGAEESDYSKAISKNFFISMIARIYDPGCKVDNMVILEGRQGAYKSSALKALGGKWYVDTVADTSTKDFYLILQGRMIVELGELTSFNKGESTAIKRAVTTASDVFRTPFDKYPAEHGRTSVFVGTTNQDEYLADSTGGRRFWPIKINTIDLNLIKQDRDQLFAEAVHCFKAGESWWNVPDSAKDEQDLRQEDEVWVDKVEEYIAKTHGRTEFSISDILEHGLSVSPDKMNKHMKDRVGNILRKMGLINKPIRVNGKLKKRWVLNPNVTHVTPLLSDSLHEIVEKKKLRNFAPGMENE